MNIQTDMFGDAGPDDELQDLVGIDISEEEITGRTGDSAASNQKLTRKLTPGTSTLIRVQVDRIDIWPGVAHELDHLDPVDLATEIEILEVSGQRAPAIGRDGPDGRIEIVGNAYLVEVARYRNAAKPALPPCTVLVDIREMDDRAAYRVVAQEIEDGPKITSLEKGLFYEKAIAEFGSEAAVARDCGIHKSTISKNLDVVRVLPIIGSKIIVHHDIAQRDASWLVAIVGRRDAVDAPDAKRREQILAAIASLELAPAKKVFKVLRDALKVEKRKKGQTALEHDGNTIGSIQRRKAGAFRIDLTDAGDVDLDALIDVLRDAIGTLRAPKRV